MSDIHYIGVILVILVLLLIALIRLLTASVDIEMLTEARDGLAREKQSLERRNAELEEENLAWVQSDRIRRRPAPQN